MGKKVEYYQKDNKIYKKEKSIFGTSTKLYGKVNKNGKVERVYSSGEQVKKNLNETLDLFTFKTHKSQSQKNTQTTHISNNVSNTYNSSNTMAIYGTHEEKMKKLSNKIYSAKKEKEKLQGWLGFLTAVCLAFVIMICIGGLGIWSSIRANNIGYKVTYYASTGGCIGVPSENTKYSQSFSTHIKAGEVGIYIEAVPNDGYEFSSWSDGYASAVRRERNVKSDMSITAYFRVKQVSPQSHIIQNEDIKDLASNYKLLLEFTL